MIEIRMNSKELHEKNIKRDKEVMRDILCGRALKKRSPKLKLRDNVLARTYNVYELLHSMSRKGYKGIADTGILPPEFEKDGVRVEIVSSCGDGGITLYRLVELD